MFVIPFLPGWLFEGPRKVRHWPRRHICAECGVPRNDGHPCAEELLVEPVGVAEVEVEPELEPPPPRPPLRGELRRVRPGRQLQRRREAWISW